MQEQEQVVSFLSLLLALAGVDFEEAGPLCAGWVRRVEEYSSKFRRSAECYERQSKGELGGANIDGDSRSGPALALVYCYSEGQSQRDLSPAAEYCSLHPSCRDRCYRHNFGL